ncbi:MAG: hypothetical protein JWO96_319 [Candidatus Saccharibacteria bacterium]|nr:hypothetical protein [Candidatus Saccharibacteria bacterium]
MKTKKKASGRKKTSVNLKRELWTVRNKWQRAALLLIALWMLFYAQVWVISTWYVKKHQNEPLHIGVTFIPDYAEYLGVDPHETLLALRDDLGIKRFRLVSYWSNIEPAPGQYDFSELDWEFNAVEAAGGQVSLAIGMRQPRWPECHIPDWANNITPAVRQADIEKFNKAVIDRYKDRKALVSYQLENEYFLTVFGQCPKPSRAYLISEFNAAKAADPKHPIILSLANNYFGVPTGQPRPDQFGISVYKRVWDQTVTKRYFEYPFSPRYYAWRSGLTELLTGKSSMLHELQAEPWPPKDVGIKDASIAEQNKSMDPARLKTRIQYGIDTGYRDLDLWGGEWWYWRKTKLNDPSLWNVIKQEMQQYNSKG